MYLFFDVETTGKPIDWNAPVEDVNNWPHIVQMAWLFYDHNRELTAQGNFIIKPDGWTIPAAATEIHGITTEKAEAEGVDLKTVLMQFEKLAKSVVLVAHNMNFDKRVTQAAFIRAGLGDRLHSNRTICTMLKSVDYCKLPHGYGFSYKWPRLSELHQKLFGCDFEGAHDAMADVQATANCFFELRNLGVIK